MKKTNKDERNFTLYAIVLTLNSGLEPAKTFSEIFSELYAAFYHGFEMNKMMLSNL
jgi:hypothetical protein